MAHIIDLAGLGCVDTVFGARIVGAAILHSAIQEELIETVGHIVYVGCGLEVCLAGMQLALDFWVSRTVGGGNPADVGKIEKARAKTFHLHAAPGVGEETICQAKNVFETTFDIIIIIDIGFS